MHDTAADMTVSDGVGVEVKGWNANSRVADGILGQGKDGTSICSPGSPEIVHYLSYGGSGFDRDRTRHSVGFTEFPQTESTVIEDNYEPLSAREHGEKVHGLFNYDLSDLSGWSVMTTPEAVKACLTD